MGCDLIPKSYSQTYIHTTIINYQSCLRKQNFRYTRKKEPSPLGEGIWHARKPVFRSVVSLTETYSCCRGSCYLPAAIQTQVAVVYLRMLRYSTVLWIFTRQRRVVPLQTLHSNSNYNLHRFPYDSYTTSQYSRQSEQFYLVMKTLNLISCCNL